MKIIAPSAVAFAIVAIAVVSSSTPVSADEAPAPEVKAEFVDPLSAAARSYRSTGEYAIDRIVMTMITDSSRAVADGKEVDALATFHLRDVAKKNGTVAGLPRIAALKFTSLKLRNPVNAPDAADAAALQEVKTQLENGTPPRILVQRIDRPNASTEWRVYKPLANIRQCGSCHGPVDQMTPELRDAIAKKYPQDEANGYQIGEWRGLVRVTVADDPKALPAPKTAPAGAKK